MQRAAKLAKYLPRFGWRPVIFTMPEGRMGAPGDPSLLDDLPDGLEVHRPPCRDWWMLVPYNIRKHIYHPIPDKHRGWADSAVEPLVRLIDDTAPDALITTSPSHSVQLLGLAAKRRTGIPWAADFRDPWTDHEDFQGKRGAARMRLDETAVITTADTVVGVYPKIIRSFEGRTDAGKLSLIENGYDEDDFRMVDRTTPSPPGPLMLGYNGTVSRYHDPSPLLKTVQDMYRRGIAGSEDMRFVFTTNAASRKWLHSYRDLTDAGMLVVRDYLPHAESLARLAGMDVSLLISTHGRDIYPAKVFEYIYLGNPVLLAGCEDDDLARLITENSAGIVAGAHDPASIEHALLDLLARKRAGTLPRFATDISGIERFSRLAVAERFAALLDRIVQRRSVVCV